MALLVDYTVCQEGDVLSSEQARILKLLGHQQAEFKLNMVSGWNKAEGNFKLFKQIEMREREREGERDRDRQRQTETDRDRQRQTDRDRQRQTETDRDRQRQTETDRDRQRQT